jgi:hypothetical protein
VQWAVVPSSENVSMRLRSSARRFNVLERLVLLRSPPRRHEQPPPPGGVRHPYRGSCGRRHVDVIRARGAQEVIPFPRADGLVAFVPVLGGGNQ